ncbi:MAG: hypothetical protein J6K19_07415 [Prevotella sp.]|nr:hypothetical protein [Prevotella sp.]
MKKILFLSAMACCLCACQESLEDRCAREAKDYTAKKCPAQVGSNVTIDSLIFERASHTMHYYYTLSGNADNPEAIAAADVRKALLDEVKNSTSIKTYKDNGYRFAYTYYSQKDHGKVLFNVTFTEKDYK